MLPQNWNTEEELRSQNEELFVTLQELADARDTIEAERQRYRDLFDFAPDAYLVTDINGKISEANRAAGGLLGMEDQHLAGRLLVTFFKGEDRKIFRARMAEMAAERHPQNPPAGRRLPGLGSRM
jgi:PAS domain-containing protein